MARTHSVVRPWGICLASLLLTAATYGCGGDESGTQVPPAPEQAQATNNMADFMKKGGGSKAAGAPAKAATPPATK